MGRHARATARRAVAAAVVALGLVGVVQVLAGPPAGAPALVGAMLVLWLGTCRVVAALGRDGAEERWLRHVLASLRPPPGEDEDGDRDLGLHAF